jgi:hypothetical protein
MPILSSTFHLFFLNPSRTQFLWVPIYYRYWAHTFLLFSQFSLSPPDAVLLLSLLLSTITEPLHYGGGNPEILNWWELFTVSIIDVNVVVVGAKQDEGEAEPKFALYFVTCTFL